MNRRRKVQKAAYEAAEGRWKQRKRKRERERERERERRMGNLAPNRAMPGRETVVIVIDRGGRSFVAVRANKIKIYLLFYETEHKIK